MAKNTYSELMVEGKSYIELRLELSEPAELFDLIGAFTAIANQFERYLREDYPNLVDVDSRIYVKQIRAGSIIADLVPFIQPLIQNMDSALVVDGFVRKYGGILTRLFRRQPVPEAKKSDLEDFMKQVAAIANDPNGSATISSAEFHQTKNQIRASVSFDTKDAKKAQQEISDHIKEIELKAYQLEENVLMVFWQSNLKQVEKGKKSGEKAIIEHISEKPLAVIYDSDLAEEKIKHETTQGERNLYKLGFYVTCRVEKVAGKPVAYRISHVHSIIDLPDD
jgi:hypothetical protein